MTITAPTVLRDLASSKKFVFTSVATLAVVAAWRFGVLTKEDVKGFLEILWAVYVGAQGVADLARRAPAPTTLTKDEQEIDPASAPVSAATPSEEQAKETS